jgi:glycine/D-amino acid oxidase-like deaminating enzyme
MSDFSHRENGLGAAFLARLAKEGVSAERFEELLAELRKLIDQRERITPEIQELVYEVEALLTPYFDKETEALFQEQVALVGGKVCNPILMPRSDTPFWLLQADELSHFRSAEKLPGEVDFLIIGAGLTGTAAAYYLSEAVAAGKSAMILEMERPAAKASGRNGGNFQLLPENSVGTFPALVAKRLEIVRQKNPDLTESEALEKARSQARTLLAFSYANADRFAHIVQTEKIACDFSPAGWLHVAVNDEEENEILGDEELNSTLASEMEIWFPEHIKEMLGLECQNAGRFLRKSGNYHPYKYILALLQKAIAKGVGLYTGVRVLRVEAQTDKVRVQTSEGWVEAKTVIAATNAFTPKLFPSLRAITCKPSQIMNLEHVPNTLRGLTVSEKLGDMYYNFPASTHYGDAKSTRRGMLHFGWDFPGPIEDPDLLKRSPEVFERMKIFQAERFPETANQPPSRCWAGPQAYTEDLTPVVGFLERNVIIAAAFQGFGGSFCTQAGYVAAQMALTGDGHPSAPEEIFSPKRFVQPVC